MKSIEQTIKDVVKALETGIHPDILLWALLSDGWHVKKANHIIRWAKHSIK
jgi:hypothetical protein